MKFTEKEFMQAKHRLEEAQARNRVKERSVRTHRLIQEGAVLEKIIPQVRQMSLEQLERCLCGRNSIRSAVAVFAYMNCSKI